MLFASTVGNRWILWVLFSQSNDSEFCVSNRDLKNGELNYRKLKSNAHLSLQGPPIYAANFRIMCKSVRFVGFFGLFAKAKLLRPTDQKVWGSNPYGRAFHRSNFGICLRAILLMILPSPCSLNALSTISFISSREQSGSTKTPST